MKLIAARCGELVVTFPKSVPRVGTKLITPSGIPASLKILKKVQFERRDVLEGFQMTTFPIRVGVALRFVPMAVKLKGEMEAMNPSSGR